MSDPRSQPVALFAERYGPLILGFVAISLVGFSRSAILIKFSSHAWATSDLYSAVFNWSAIQTGFAFAVYGFVAGKSDGFVDALKETFAMRRFLRYVKAANVGGFLLTITSIPLTITNPSPSQSGLVFWIIAFWLGLFVWTFFAFLRVAFNFGRLANVRDREPFYGA